MTDIAEPRQLRRTPLYALHVELGARMVPFAGYEMPVQYPAGILAEHLHTRAEAGLFDVSHMGQVALLGADRGAALETLVPGDIAGWRRCRMRYTLLLNEAGGIIDDLMATGSAASCSSSSTPRRRTAISLICARISAARDDRRSTTARCSRCKGPAAAAVLARLAPRRAALPFMTAAEVALRRRSLPRHPLRLYRRGWLRDFAAGGGRRGAGARLLAEPEVQPIGLGARDSLRLEAGLCLYGHDIDETTTPVEADLGWAIGKRRREEGGFPGAGDHRAPAGARPAAQARRHPARRTRTGARGHADRRRRRRAIGRVTSGGLAPRSARRWRWAMSMPPAAAAARTTRGSSARRSRGTPHGPRRDRRRRLPFVPALATTAECNVRGEASRMSCAALYQGP